MRLHRKKWIVCKQIGALICCPIWRHIDNIYSYYLCFSLLIFFYSSRDFGVSSISFILTSYLIIVKYSLINISLFLFFFLTYLCFSCYCQLQLFPEVKFSFSFIRSVSSCWICPRGSSRREAEEKWGRGFVPPKFHSF